MPFKSMAQMRYMNANKDEMEKQGVNVDEFNEASKGKDLPERITPHKGATQLVKKFSRKGKKH